MLFEDVLKIKKGDFFWNNASTGSQLFMVAEEPIATDVSVEFLVLQVDPLDRLVVKNKYVFVKDHMHYAARLGNMATYFNMKYVHLYDTEELKSIIIDQIGTFDHM